MSAKSAATSSSRSNSTGSMLWFWTTNVSCIPSPTKRSRRIERTSCGSPPASGLRMKNASTLPWRSPSSSQMQKVAPSSIRNCPCTLSLVSQYATTGGLRQGLDDKLIDVHVRRAGEGEDNAFGDVLRGHRLDALVNVPRGFLVAPKANEREVRVHEAGIHGGDVDRTAQQVLAQGVREAADRELRCHVERAFLVRLPPGDGADVDDVAPVAKVRQAEARHPDKSVHVRLEDRALVVLGAVVERVASECEAGGIDEDVDPAQLLGSRRDETLTALRIGDVQLERRHRGSNAVGPPRTAYHTDALPRQRLRRGRADAARRAGDDGRLSLQGGHRGSLTALDRGAARDRLAELDRRRARLGMVDLQRRVREPEAIREGALEAASRRVTVGARRDEHVRREGRKAARHGPHVQVVHLDDVALRDERTSDRLRVGIAWSPLEEDARRLPEETSARPEHQCGDGETGDRVEAVPAGREDQPAGERRGGEGGHVRDEMQERAADVEALPTRACEHEAGSEADERTCQRDDEDETAANVTWLDQPMDRRPDDQDCDQPERDPVRLRGEDLEPRITERPAAGRRAARHDRGHDREDERGRIGE